MDAVTEYRIGRKTLTPGSIVQIRGARGTFTFVKATTSHTGEVSLDFVGGVTGHYSFRSFRPDRVKKVLKYVARQ